MALGLQHGSAPAAQFRGSPSRCYYAGRDIARVRSIGDLRARTRKLMPHFVLEYLKRGSGEEATLARERKSFFGWSSCRVPCARKHTGNRRSNCSVPRRRYLSRSLQGDCAYGADGVQRAIELLKNEMTSELEAVRHFGIDALSPELFIRVAQLPLER